MCSMTVYFCPFPPKKYHALVRYVSATLFQTRLRCIFTDLHYCVGKDDRRLKPVCNHPLNNNNRGDLMMGYDECTSPSGVYELEIPVNRTLSCTSTVMRDTNCKDLDVSYYYLLICL